MKISLLLWLILAASAVAVPSKKPAPTLEPKPPCCREGLPPGKYSENSIFTLDAKWTSDVGKEIRLDVLRGRPQVVALFFSNCQHSCPLIVADMKHIEKTLPAKARAKVDFLLVSIDPERDTPAALHAFREKYSLGTEHWTLLRGSADSVKRLAEMLGFRYFPGSSTQFAHSLLITGINGAGEIVYQQSGIGVDSRGMVSTLVRLAK
ncbi:MAG: SCO family protein [Chthoniobacteraceae bacterium]